MKSVFLDDEIRREIYAKAVSLRDCKGMHEKRQEFTVKFYKITRAELDAIVAQGDRENWPRD